MSITRREFILGTARSAAGLILPAYYDKVLAYFENHGEPLLKAPRQFDQDLYCDFGNEFQLNLGKPVYELPKLTWREVFQRYSYDDEDGFAEEFGLTEAMLGEVADEDAYFDYWAACDSPNAKAYRLLDGFDIGRMIHHGDKIGELKFIDCPCPGSDYVGVHADCEVTLSLLQNRLNELGTGIRVLTFSK